MNPYDSRGLGWTFFNEIRAEYDFKRFALSLGPRGGGAKTDPKTCEDMSQGLGEHQVEREGFSRTHGAKGDSTSSQLQRAREWGRTDNAFRKPDLYSR